MKTSIKSNLFFITYSIFLSFIVALIILSNTYLESYYINQRQDSLLSAFKEVKEINIEDSDLFSQVLDVENEFNISIQILKQTDPDAEIDDNPIGGGGFNFDLLPVPYDRVYGNQFSIRDSVIAMIMRDFSTENETEFMNLIDHQEDYNEDGYTLYTANLTPNPGQNSDDIQLVSLLVEKEEADGLNLYYIFAVTIQSIQDSVSVFNSFTIFVGIGFMFLAAVVVYFASYKFTNPILEITQVTKNMANLDFSKKVEITSTDELGILGDSINKMSTQLEKSISDLQSANKQLSADIELKTKIDDMRKEFIASASHELKTPISLIMGYSEALKLSGLDQATIDEYLEIIMDESNKMNKLVMGMLKLSQLESGVLDINPSEVSISRIVEDTVHLFKVKFDEAKVVIELNIQDQVIYSDYDHLQTVLSNFISNALNHVDRKKKVSISSLQLENGDTHIEVYNSGKHIPEKDVEHIWDSFYKVDKARTRSYGGQGLGLSIVKNILNSLGYPFGVKNTDDGTIFYFDIIKAKKS
ncbi:MAG: HAMP domain-containing histidine kinase [Firmicutes bacterium]|nr:HAMP domain-containing histidine kinase [Bacillota bacterium]